MVMSSPSQVLRQAEALKATIADSPKSIFELWVTRQRLEDLYKKLLLMDLEYALDKKVEQDLWNHAFKNQINVLQSQAKDKQNPKRGEVQASLNLFLETASGFFTQLSQLICSTFRLDLPFRRKASSLGIIKEKSPLKSKVAPPKKSSCLYMVQYCLVHLGDIARYRQQVDQAETYYRHAANLIPQNGHPYNQLAILEAARGSKLSTVFYYMRSLAVRSPFPVAATNLEKFYAKLIKDITDSRSKLSMSEVVSTFLQFNALLHLSSELPKAAILRDRLMASLPPHITSQSFQAVVLVHFAAISLFTLHHIRDGSSTSPPLRDSPAPRNGGRPMDRSQEEEKAFQLALSFLVSFLDALLQYTPKQGQKAREFFTLPAVRVVLDWLALHRDTLHSPLLASSSVWGQLCKVLNCILPSAEETSNLDLAKYEEMPLMEDQELRCFQPIEKAHQALSFSRLPSEGLSVQVEALLRCKRLVAHGEWIAQDFPNLILLTCQTKNGRPFFSTPPQTSNANETGGERKTTRQNVAIQAIIQKQSSARKMEAPATGSKQQGGGDAEARPAATGAVGQTGSPKYVLGVPTTEPQFMKHSSSGRQGGGQGGGQYPRYPSPSPLSQSSSQTPSSTPTSGSQPPQRSSNPPPPPHSSRNQGTFTPNLPPRLSPAAQNQNQNQGHGHVGASASQGSSVQATHGTPAPPRQAWAQHGPGVRETGSQEWGALVPGDRDRHHPPPGTAAKGSPSSPSAVSGGSQPTSPLGPGPRGGMIRPPQPPTPKLPSNQEELMSALRLASQLSNPNSPLCTKAGGAPLPVSMAQPGLSSQGPTSKVGPLGQGGPGLGFNPMGMGPGLMGPRGSHLGPGIGQMPGATGQMGPGSGPPLSGMLGSGMSQLGPGMNPLNVGPMGPGVVRPGMGQVAPASGPRMGFPQAPGTERCQNSPKMLQQQQQQQPSTHTPGAPPPAHPHPQPPTSVFQSQQSHPTAFTKFPSHHPLSYAPPGAQRVAASPFHPSLYGGDENGGGVSSSYISSISQLTIQPPKPAEMRHNSTFQGHAEGTPKPDSIFPESGELELEKSGEGTPSQPGTYSLFSGSSWSAPLSTSNDSKSHGSSPFSSAGSSIRNSPEHPLEGAHLGGAGAGRGRMPSGGHSGGAPSPLEGLRYDRHSHWGVMSPSPLNDPSTQPPPASHPQAQPQPPNPQQSASFLASSIQSIWASSQTLSPLERLLEQQRHRQNEPH